MAYRIAPRAARDLDEIWHHVARESGRLEVADRLIGAITARFLLLGNFPWIGHSREQDLGSRRRSFAVGEYVIVYRIDDEQARILRVVHGRRDLERLFG